MLGKKRIATVAVLALGLLAGCQPNQDYKPGGPKVQKCDATCKMDSDTITVEATWLPPGAGPVSRHKGTVVWSKAGVQQYSGSKPVGTGTGWAAYEHDWAEQGFPKITVTADEEGAHGYVTCRIWYTPKGSHTPEIIDFVQRGEKDAGGNASCSTDLWLKDHPKGK